MITHRWGQSQISRGRNKKRRGSVGNRKNTVGKDLRGREGKTKSAQGRHLEEA